MSESKSIIEIWVYLSGSPLLALTLTLAAYQTGLWFYQKMNQNPLANPLILTIFIITTALHFIGMSYDKYFQGAQFIHFLLGSATVSLAIPIYKGINQLKDRMLPLLASLITGGLVSILTSVGICILMGCDKTITDAFYAKSVTAPIAMGIAERIGASPTLTAVFAVLTGITGSILVPLILNAMNFKIWWQRGFVVGIVSHGIGTSRAFSINNEAGTYSSLAMGLHGILGALTVPLIYQVLNH